MSKRSVSLDDAVADAVERAAKEDGLRGVEEWEVDAGALSPAG